MTHTKARSHEVKNWREGSFETFVPSCLRVRFPLIAARRTRLDHLRGVTKMIRRRTAQPLP